MKSKSNKFVTWKSKTRTTLRERKRRKQYKLHTPEYHKPIDYLNQHLDLKNFKKFQCNRPHKHDHTQCFDFHSKNDHIRCTREVDYSPELCPHDCDDPNCRSAHNPFEKWFHPSMYKRVFCKSMFEARASSEDGDIKCRLDGKCPLKDFCPFAHNEEEIRTELFYNYEVDDDFMMFKFKTETCPLTCVQHDHQKCLYSHGAQDHRRMVVFMSYSPQLCEHARLSDQEAEELLQVMHELSRLECYDAEMCRILKVNLDYLQDPAKAEGECPDGFDCRKCHNALEFLYHPSVYKAIGCKVKGDEHDESMSTGMLGSVDDTFELFEPAKTEKNEHKEGCGKTHCPFSHEGDKHETLQESTEFPFYKFAYNRIAPGAFFMGNSFFSNRSENLVYPEDRLLGSQPMGFGFHGPQGPMYPQFAGAQMDPQKLYFKARRNQWEQGGLTGSKGENKENQNCMNFMSPVNMNMYRIQMNNTFLMPNQGMGYMPRPQYLDMQAAQMKGFQGAFGPHLGYQQGFYRC